MESHFLDDFIYQTQLHSLALRLVCPTIRFRAHMVKLALGHPLSVRAEYELLDWILVDSLLSAVRLDDPLRVSSSRGRMPTPLHTHTHTLTATTLRRKASSTGSYLVYF